MLEKSKVLPIIIAALQDNSEDSINMSLHALGDEGIQKARNIASNIRLICTDYDYFQSADFQDRIKGQSEAYINFVKQGFSQAHEDRLLEAIRNIEKSDTIFDLIQNHQKQYVTAIRKNLAQL